MLEVRPMSSIMPFDVDNLSCAIYEINTVTIGSYFYRGDSVTLERLEDVIVATRSA